MGINLKGRHFLTLGDFGAEEIQALLEFALELKREKRAGIRPRRLAGRNIALIFEKPSTRTRCAFSVACADEGGHAEYLGKDEIQLGKKESVRDTARVLGRMFDAIEFRGFSHETVEELARYAGVPVWNGLTDRFHPTQVLADFMTILEERGYLRNIRFAYAGDGRSNMANSLMLGAAKMGMDFRILSHPDLFPDAGLVAMARDLSKLSGGGITLTSDTETGVAGADVIYTDVWASMGEEDQIGERIRLLRPYQVNQALLERTGNPGVIFMHCLPAFHNTETLLAQKYPAICETTEEVFEGPHSRVFEEAENRLHTIKAVMVATLTDGGQTRAAHEPKTEGL